MPDHLLANIPTACWHGTIKDKSVRALIQEAKRAATLIWCEPVNGKHRVQDLTTLANATEWNAPPDIPLAEGRVFFADGLLHLLAGSGETHFAAWVADDGEEGKDSPPSRPAWCPAPAHGPLAAMCVKRERSILLADPRARQSATAVRRGLSGSSLGKQIQAIEYYEQGNLRWWRLTYDGQA